MNKAKGREKARRKGAAFKQSVETGKFPNRGERDKGVNSTFEYTRAKKGPGGKAKTQDLKGKSHKGHWARYSKDIKSAGIVGGGKTKEQISRETAENAKQISRKNIKDLKEMPKPNLPKSEKGIDKLKKFQKSKMEKCKAKGRKK